MNINFDTKTFPRWENNDKCYFSNISTPNGNSSFFMSTHCEKDINHFDFLFPESINSTSKKLHQGFINLHEFENSVKNLTNSERLSIRGWCALDTEIESGDYDKYTDGSSVVTFGENYELNKKLANFEILDESETSIVNDISSGLKKLPPISGEFIRISEHSESCPSPWGNKIRINDIVSCAPCFMSASLDFKYSAYTFQYNALLFPDKTNVIVVYKIICHEHCSTGIPLLSGILSPPDLDGENEILFDRASFFRVDGIASAIPVNNAEASLKRIGVILTQVHPQQCNVKNIYTGEEIRETYMY